jgi:hypothetical protein
VSDSPLSPKNNTKIVFFLLLLLPTIPLLVGLLPSVILVFGYIAMRKYRDFNYMASAIKGAQGYIALAALGAFGFASFYGYLAIQPVPPQTPYELKPERLELLQRRALSSSSSRFFSTSQNITEYLSQKEFEDAGNDSSLADSTYFRRLAASLEADSWEHSVATRWEQEAQYNVEQAKELLLSCLAILSLLALYAASVQWLLAKPLLAHKVWVEANGIFSSKASTAIVRKAGG